MDYRPFFQMEKPIRSPILSAPAALWNGIRQLPGTLELWETEVVFRLNDFKDSHLNLSIALLEIEKVEEFLVYDLARNGLRIQNKDGNFDLFVLDEAPRFKRLLEEHLARFRAD